MPRIPTYQSNQRLNTPSLPQKSGADLSSARNAQKGAIQAIDNAQDQFLKIRDFRQVNEAQAYGLDKLNEQKSLAEQDINTDPRQYEKEIDKIASEASKNISGQLAREEFVSSFKRQSEAAKWAIRSNFRAKEVQQASAMVKYRGEQLKENYPLMDEAGRITSIANYRLELKKAEELGIYTPDMRKMVETDFIRDIYESHARYDAENNPDEFLANINEKESPYEVSDAVKKETIDLAKKKVLTNKANADKFNKEQEVSKTLEVAKSMIDPQGQKFSVAEVMNMMGEENPISADLGRAYINATTSEVLAKDDLTAVNQDFYDFAEKIFESEDDDAIINAMANVLNGGAGGKINQRQLRILMQVALEHRGDLKEEKTFRARAWQALKGGAPGLNAGILAYNFIKNLAEGEEPNKAMNKAKIDVAKEKNLNLTDIPPEGKIAVDKYGNKARIYPDGRIEEIK